MYVDRNSQPTQSSKVTACCYCAACICSLSSCRDGCTQLASVSKTFYLLLRHHPRQASARPRPRKKKWGPGYEYMANWFCHCLASKFFRMLPPMFESGIRLKNQDDEVDLRGFACTLINANAGAPLPSFRISLSRVL
jgi:hypothetical protein